MTNQDVIQMRQIAYVMAQTVAASARIEGMKAVNIERDRNGFALAYTEEDFEGVITQFGLGHNAVVQNLAP